MRTDAQISTGRQSFFNLIHGPGLTCFGIATNFRSGKSVEGFVIGRIYGNQLALQVRRELCDLDTILTRNPDQLFAIGARLGGFGQIKNPSVPTGYLNPGIAAVCRPFCDPVPRVERCFITGKLCKK
jgi:hypothetical protein